MWLATAALVAVLLGFAGELFSRGSQSTGTGGMPTDFLGQFGRDACQFAGRALAVSGLILDAALAVIIGFGVWRWYSESRLNLRLAKADAAQDPNRGKNAIYWDLLIEMLDRQRFAGLLFLFVALPLVAAAIGLDLVAYWHDEWAFYGPPLLLLVLPLAILNQAGINSDYGPDS